MLMHAPFRSHLVRRSAGGGAILAAALALLSGRPAVASETKTYPAAFCVPAQNLYASSVLATNGTVQATSDSTLIVCPIVKSVASDPKIDSVTINMVAAGASGAPTCDLWALKAAVDTASTKNAIAHQTGTVSADRKTITFSSFAQGKPAPFDNLIYYQINCRLRAQDKLLDYVVKEAGTNTDAFKIYSPGMCRPDPDENTSPFQHRTPSDNDSGGWLQAMPGPNNTGELHVVCPVINDHVTTNSTGTAQAAIAVGKPSNNTQSIQCTLGVSNNYSLPSSSTSFQVFGDSSAQFPTLTKNIDLIAGVLGGRYHIYCTASAAGDSKILGYRIQEN